MNARQFAFIICTNNMQYYNECVRYIQDLYVPEEYDIDIICIQEADSMTQGYNAGMQASNALYKVYLHQDTFILNRNFLYDILRIFRSDERIGMIGVLGARDLPQDANCYLKWDTGRIIAYNGAALFEGNLYQNNGYIPVKAIDGLIMITQTDIQWREDFLDGWDFYDVSQSLEMDRHGYKVVIPYQEKPWCYHDCGVSKIGQYHFYRRKIVEEYPEYFPEYGMQENLEMIQLEQEQINEVRSGMIELFSLGAYDELVDVANYVRQSFVKDTCMREIVNLMEIYSMEKASEGSNYSEWWLLKDWEQIYKYYQWLRFVLLRIEYQREDERVDEVSKLIKESRISREAVRRISIATLGSTERIDASLLKTENE